MAGSCMKATPRSANALPRPTTATRNAASKARAACWSAAGSRARKEIAFLSKKVLYHFGSIFLLSIHGIVHTAHVFGRNFSTERPKRGADLRISLKRLPADDGHGIIGREVVAIVFEH